jgi:D-glycerate 3-kinase
MTEPDLGEFLEKHRLPEAYVELAHRWFFRLADEIASHQKQLGDTLVLGINGSQGSGKSTLADLLHYLFTQSYQLSTVSLSIDDFYYTRKQREQFARTVHPLLLTRGVPGTHDVDLLIDTIDDLRNEATTTAIPRFDKATDDRMPRDRWDSFKGSPAIIILEGWCIGAEPQDETELIEPVNKLEASEDSNGAWRRYVNQALGGKYQALFAVIDLWVMLKAPSFDCVYQWRLEQEDKLRSSIAGNGDTVNPGNRVMSESEISRFIQHYQRITENILRTLPPRVDYLYELDSKRNIIEFQRRKR